MNERDKKLLNKISDRLGAYGDEWPESMVIGCLRIIDRLDKQLTEIKETYTPRLQILFDGFYIIDDQCECEEGCGPECINDAICPCIAHEVRRLAEVLKGVKDE